MKIRIELTDDSGQLFTGEVDLAPVRAQRSARPSNHVVARKSSTASRKINFELPLRPFLKTYSKATSGAAKFTILLAHLAKGQANVPIKRVEIERAWSKVTSHLGDFNPAHTTRAKDEGWVDSPRKGEYVLLPGWIAALATEE